MLHFAHLSNQVGSFYQLWMRIAPRADHVNALGTLHQRFYYAFRIDHFITDHVIDLVKHHQVVLFTVNLLPPVFPSLLAEAKVFWIGRSAAHLYKTSAHRPDFKFIVTEHLGCVQFPIMPRALDELHHQDAQPLSHRAKSGSQGTRSLTFARPGVNNQQSFSFGHRPSPRTNNS